MARRESRLSVLYPGERQDIELFVSCRDLKSPDLFRSVSASISLYVERNGEYDQTDQTERIKGNSNPDFKKSFNLEFFFAVKQQLKLVVTDALPDGTEKPIGEVLTSVGQIMGNKNQIITFDIRKDAAKESGHMGKLTIRAERINYTSDVAKMTIKARKLKISKGFFSKPSLNLALRLYRYLGEPGYGLIYESEIRRTDNPRWSEIQLKFQKLANGDYDRNIKAQVVNYSSTEHSTVIGECLFTVNSLLQNEALDFELQLHNPKNNQKCGVLIVDSFDLIERPHFLDYLQAGLQFNVMIGIDYTSSNGDPFTPDSLHTLVNDDKDANEYLRAITGVCEILLNYDHDKKVLMFGFGGIPNFPQFKSELTSHCFPLTGDIFNPWAENLDGILKVYQNSFKNIQLASPTYFEPIMRQAMQIAKRNLERDTNEYTILLILTDGKCHDMQDTINSVIESAYLPLSVIIVGVGKDDFKKMDILDGDNGLINFKGQQAVRDLVQFVPFRSFENNPDLLAKNVLAEIPSQVVNYMLSQGIKPKTLQALQKQETKKPAYHSADTGTLDDDTVEENKEVSFNNTQLWPHQGNHKRFSTVLEFMRKEHNASFINSSKNNNKEKSDFGTVLHTINSSFSGKGSNDIQVDDNIQAEMENQVENYS